VYVKLHDNEKFREWYEKEKDNFIADTIEKGGKFKSTQENIEIEQEELDELEIELQNKGYSLKEIEIYLTYKRTKYSSRILGKIFGLSHTKIGQIIKDMDNVSAKSF